MTLNKEPVLFLRSENIVTLRKQGMLWNGMEDDFSIFHTAKFLPFHIHSILKIFHSIFHFILIFFHVPFHSSILMQFNVMVNTLSANYAASELAAG